MWRTGLSNDMPHMASTTIWCDSPMPRASRPVVAFWVVSAWAASIIGCRGYVGNDGRPELDAGHLAADDRKRGQRVEAEDLREPVAGESVVDGLLHHLHQLVHPAGTLADLTTEYPDAHEAARYRRSHRCSLGGRRRAMGVQTGVERRDARTADRC